MSRITSWIKPLLRKLRTLMPYRKWGQTINTSLHKTLSLITTIKTSFKRVSSLKLNHKMEIRGMSFQTRRWVVVSNITSVHQRRTQKWVCKKFTTRGKKTKTSKKIPVHFNSIIKKIITMSTRKWGKTQAQSLGNPNWSKWV